MKLPLLLAITSLASAPLALPAWAQEAQCFQNESYRIIARQRAEEVGTDFIIRLPAGEQIACLFEPRDGDVLIGSPDDPLWYEALLGNYLVLTRSTGPQGDLVIYDLAADPTVPLIDLPAEDDMVIGETDIVFWERTTEGTADNCPQYAEHQSYGFGSVIVAQRIFDVATGRVSSTGLSRCNNTQ